MAPDTPLQKTSRVLSSLMNWTIVLLLVVMGCWLYALTTAALLKYLGS